MQVMCSVKLTCSLKQYHGGENKIPPPKAEKTESYTASNDNLFLEPGFYFKESFKENACISHGTMA